MQTPALVVPERPRDLIDGDAVGRQEPLHGELGRSLQVEHSPTRSAVPHPQRGKMGIGTRGVPEYGGLHFEHPALAEKGPHTLQEPAPRPQGLERRRGAPVLSVQVVHAPTDPLACGDAAP